MNNYRFFFYFYILIGRASIEREKREKEICWLYEFHSSFGFVLSLRLSMLYVCMGVLYPLHLYFDSFVINDLYDCIVCLFTFRFIHLFVRSYCVCIHEPFFLLRILSFDWIQMTQWKMWFAAKAIHIHESFWIN